MEPYTSGTWDSVKYILPHLTEVGVTVNGSPNML